MVRCRGFSFVVGLLVLSGAAASSGTLAGGPGLLAEDQVTMAVQRVAGEWVITHSTPVGYDCEPRVSSFQDRTNVFVVCGLVEGSRDCNHLAVGLTDVGDWVTFAYAGCLIGEHSGSLIVCGSSPDSLGCGFASPVLADLEFDTFVCGAGMVNNGVSAFKVACRVSTR